MPDAVTAALLRWHDEDEVHDPREPYAEWMHEVARINRIWTVYKLVSGPRWGEHEFEELLDLYHKWIRADLRDAPAPRDEQEAIYLGALYVCRMTNDWFDRTRTILDLGLRASEEGQVARPVFDLAMESPITLLGYIYFRLAQDFARAARFGRCPGCGTIFKTEKGDRRTYDTPKCAPKRALPPVRGAKPGIQKEGRASPIDLLEIRVYRPIGSTREPSDDAHRLFGKRDLPAW